MDADARPSSARANIGSMRRVIRWTRDGRPPRHISVRHRVSIYVWAAAFTIRRGIPDVATLVRMTGATVVPIYFKGPNSLPFQLAGLLHPGLRTLLLAARSREAQALDGSRTRRVPADPRAGVSLSGRRGFDSVPSPTRPFMRSGHPLFEGARRWRPWLPSPGGP